MYTKMQNNQIKLDVKCVLNVFIPRLYSPYTDFMCNLMINTFGIKDKHNHKNQQKFKVCENSSPYLYNDFFKKRNSFVFEPSCSSSFHFSDSYKIKK